VKRVTVWGTTLKKVADEAQMISHYEIIKTFAPNAQVTMLTYSRPLVEQSYGGLIVTAIPQLHKSLPRIFKSDLFVIGGGPFFDHLPHLLRVAALLFVLWLARVPVLIYGVTGFPVKSWFGKSVFRWMGNHAKKIVTRDASAYRLLSEIGVKTPLQQGIDLRAILTPAPHLRVQEILRLEGIDPDKPMVGLTIRYIDKNIPDWVKTQVDMHEEGIDRFNDALGRVVAELSKSAQVFIIAMHPDVEEDLAAAKNIRKHMADPSQLKLIGHRYLAVETLGIIGACDLLIAGRVGSAFFATMLGTPLLAISHESRMTDWMEEIGMKEYLFDWHSLDAGAMLQQLAKLTQSREEVLRIFKAKAEASRKQAWRDAEAYRAFLVD